MSIQDKFNRKNVIYKITRDIDLGGETLTIPEGCTLDFQGGSLSNGIIVGQYTDIKGKKNIFDNILLNGTFANNDIKIEWFKLLLIDGVYELGNLLNNLLTLNYPHNVILEAKTYSVNLSNIIINEFSALVGNHHTNTLINAYSDADSYFYLALKRGSGLRNFTMRVNEGREIPIIYTDSALTGDYANVHADWEQCINNVYLINSKYFSDGTTLDNIKTTGIKFNVGPYNHLGELVQMSDYSLSYRGNYDMISIKGFKQGIELHVEETVPDGYSTPWCTSVYFSRLNIYAERGFVGSGSPTGYTTLTDYLFQRLHKSSTAEDYVIPSPVYGKFEQLTLINMINWDYSYRGTVEGSVVDIAPTYRDVLHDTVCGFLKLTPESTLRVSNTSPWAGSLDVNSGATNDAKTRYVSSIGGMQRGFHFIYGAEQFGAADMTRRVRRYVNTDNTLLLKDELRMNNKVVQTREEHENGDYIRQTNGDYKISAKNIVFKNKKIQTTSFPSVDESSDFAFGTMLNGTYNLAVGGGGMQYGLDTYGIYKTINIGGQDNYYLGSFKLPAKRYAICNLEINYIKYGKTLCEIILSNTADLDVGIINIKNDFYKKPVSGILENFKYTYKISSDGTLYINLYFIPQLNTGIVTWLKFKANSSLIGLQSYTEYEECNSEGIVKIPYFNKYGAFVYRPTYDITPIGFEYFCTDAKIPEGTTDGIMIYHKGNNVWVDALGRIVE